jgi:chromosome segregation ATPase
MFNDATQELKSRRKVLESRLASDDLERANTALAKADAAYSAHVNGMHDNRHSWGAATDTKHPSYIHGEELKEERDRLGAVAQRLQREYDKARDELNSIAPMLDSAGSIKAAKRQLADADVALRDLEDAVANHAALVKELPDEITALEQRKKDVIAAHATAEAKARAAKAAAPAFPAEVSQIAAQIESKQATLAAASGMHDEARAALPGARDAVIQARQSLRGALHARAQLEFFVATASLGPAVAMLVATASDYSELAREQKATVTASEDELAAARTQVAKEFA